METTILMLMFFFEAKPGPVPNEAPDIYQDWNATSSSTQTGNGEERLGHGHRLV